ncbi:MAG: hypothetical protein JXO72_01930 [Vicinamibacteria bacterium]|nr:hypothetical protein [Vicinamibacteria bacterium]
MTSLRRILIGSIRVASVVMLVELPAGALEPDDIRHADLDARRHTELCLGSGLGVPFGGLGTNFEFNPRFPTAVTTRIHDYTSISVGLGVTPAAPGYAVGVRLYPWGKDGKWLPRFSVHYGVVGLFEYNGVVTDAIEGFAFSAGVRRRMSQNWSFEAEVVYIAPDEFGDDVDSRIKLSLGLHRHFR